MVRRVFYSFHYEPDKWRTAQVRNIGAIEDGQLARDNEWEKVAGGSDKEIIDWIADQMKGRSCTIVLIGTDTAGRKWINHEIIKSWYDNMGLVGIHIHGLEDRDERISRKGKNPFDLSVEGRNLSSIVKCHDPYGADSRARYNWIRSNLSDLVEQAIQIRLSYPRSNLGELRSALERSYDEVAARTQG